MHDGLLVGLALPLVNVVIMLAVGLVLGAAELAAVARAPRPLAVGLAGQFLGLPLLAFVIAWAWRLPPAFAIGLVLVAACPGASASNLLSHMARGNVGLAVAMTALGALVALVSLPLFVGLATHAWNGARYDLQLPIIATLSRLVLLVLLPLAVGMGARRYAPALAAPLSRWLGLVGLLALFAVVIAYALTQRQLLVGAIIHLWLPVLSLNVGSMALGALVARGAGLARDDIITVAMESGVHNCMLALLVAFTLMGSAEVAMPALAYGVLMFGPALALVAIGRRRSGREAMAMENPGQP